LEAPFLHLLAKAVVGTKENYPIHFEITDTHTPLNFTYRSNALGTGFFDVQIKGKGLLSNLETLEASAKIQNLQLMLLGQEIRNSRRIEVGYAGQHLNILNLALESGDSRLQLSGALPLHSEAAPAEVALKARLNLSSLSGVLPTMKFLKAQGIAELDGKIKGSLAQPEPSGLLTLRDGQLQIEAIPSPVMNLSAELEAENGLVSLKALSGTLGDGTIRASGSFPLKLSPEGMTFGSESLARSAQFSVQAEKIRWSSLLRVPEKTSGYFSVNVSGEASHLTLKDLSAQAQFGDILVKQAKYELKQVVPTILNLRNAQIQVEQFRWKGPQTELRVAGTADLEADHPLDLRLSGDADASLLQLFVPAVQASGPARLDLSVRGTAGSPLLVGYVGASKATVGLRSPRLLGEDVALRIDFNGDRLNLTELTGSLNGGSLRGSGGAAWRNGRLEDVSLDFKGQDVFLNFPTGFKTTSKLDLEVRSRGRSIQVGGKVEVREGSYNEPFEVGMISEATAQSIRTTSESEPQGAGSDIFYNIQLRTQQPIDVDNNLARFYASADLKLVGSVRRPGLLGTTQLEPGGKLYFGDRTYLIEQGVVTFTNENRIDPVFDVFATTRVKDYEIGLRLTGTLKDSETTFTSDPPLSRDDIVSVLLTGKTLSESGGTGINPSQAGTFSLATGAMNVNLSGKLRRAIGVSQVSIEPGLIAAEDNPGARLTIGQDLTRNLRLVYSMNLTNSSDQIWIAEYDIRRRFVARAVQQTSDTNRVEFRHDLRFGGSSEPLTGIGVTGAPKRRVGRVDFTGNISFENPPYKGGQQPSGCGGCPSGDMRGAREGHPPTPPSKGESSILSKQFKVKPGDKYDFVKVRKGVERVEKFYHERDYLESRVRLQTSERVGTVDLSAHIEAGRKVRLTYEGAALPKAVKKVVRQEWQSSLSDVQRSEDAIRAIQVHLAKEGYLQARVSSRAGEGTDQEKRVLFDMKPGIRFRNVKLVFEGLEKEEAGEVVQFLERRNLKDSVYSDPRLLIEAVTRYLRQRGYLLAQVAPPQYQLDAETRTGRIVVPVSQGPEFTVAALRFSGNSSLTDAQLKTKLPIIEGSVFDPSQIPPTLAALREQYGRSGFRNAEVDYDLVRDDSKSAVEIRFTIQEKLKSVIQSVKIEGEDKVSEKFIRRQIELSEGETQDASETNRSIRRLYSTGAFARVDLENQPLPDLPTNTQRIEPVNVVVRVQETRPYKFVYGGYFDSDRGPGVIAESEARNLLGSARLLGLRTRLDRDYQEGRLYLTQPPLRQLPLQSTITGYWKDEKVRNAYNLETLGFTFQQEGRLREKFLFSYGYRYEKKHASLLSDPLFPNLHYSVAPLLATLSRTSRDDYLDPTRGSFTSHAVEFAPEKLGSTFGYVRYFGQYFRYFPLSQPQYVPFGGETRRPRFIYATGLRVGLMKGLTRYDIVPSERFFAGGGTTVRGFEQDKLGPVDRFGNPLGGNAMFVLNNELRFPFVSILDAVGFVDIGNVYPTVSDFSFSDLRKTAGFGLRLRTPFLMIRFDYGFKLDRRPGESQGAFFVSIGQAF
jgi:outer membrane protein assembly complex protein YaeT